MCLLAKFCKVPLQNLHYLPKRLPNISPPLARGTCDKKSDLKEILRTKIAAEQERIKKFRKEHGKTKVGEVTIDMMYGGMRGIKGLVYETSLLDANEGIRFRGLSIPECHEVLPRAPDGCEPLPEGIFWLLLTGDCPTEDQVRALSKEWNKRAKLPPHVVQLLENLPNTVHPMAQFVAGITACSSESKFSKAYNEGMKKAVYWEYAYEDVMDLMANLPLIAAIIYNRSYRNEETCLRVDANKDWSYNFADLIGFEDPGFVEMLRLYLTLHCDHEGGNVSAHTVHLVGSALSDPYLSFAAGMCGLAGPLHGLANQEVLVWLSKLKQKLGDSPSEDQVKTFVEETLKSGQVVPGYGHAVLRKTDPRYVSQKEFAERHFPDYPLYKVISTLYKVVPPILKATGKVQNPWPNVDAHSGVLMQYYGLTQMNYYTVFFGVSRAIGVLTALIWSRALGLPIERPKSMTTDALMELVKK
nr:unnamed protein product [Callosobruchus chinensis]